MAHDPSSKSAHRPRAVCVFHRDPISPADAVAFFDTARRVKIISSHPHLCVVPRPGCNVHVCIGICIGTTTAGPRVSSPEVRFSDRLALARFSSALSVLRYRATKYAGRCVSAFSFRTRGPSIVCGI